MKTDKVVLNVAPGKNVIDSRKGQTGRFTESPQTQGDTLPAKAGFVCPGLRCL